MLLNFAMLLLLGSGYCACMLLVKFTEQIIAPQS